MQKYTTHYLLQTLKKLEEFILRHKNSFLQSLESRQGLVIKVDDKYDDSYNGPEGELESYKAHIQFWLHYLGTKKLDGETAQHWLEKERDRLQRRLAIIEDMISGFEK
jgi:hypothetical protein